MENRTFIGLLFAVALLVCGVAPQAIMAAGKKKQPGLISRSTGTPQPRFTQEQLEERAAELQAQQEMQQAAQQAEAAKVNPQEETAETLYNDLVEASNPAVVAAGVVPAAAESAGNWTRPLKMAAAAGTICAPGTVD